MSADTLERLWLGVTRAEEELAKAERIVASAQHGVEVARRGLDTARSIADDLAPAAWLDAHRDDPRCFRVLEGLHVGCVFEAIGLTADHLELRELRFFTWTSDGAVPVWRSVFVRCSDGVEVRYGADEPPVLTRAQIATLVAALGGP